SQTNEILVFMSFLSVFRDPRDLHSFPTRRSSDLGTELDPVKRQGHQCRCINLAGVGDRVGIDPLADEHPANGAHQSWRHQLNSLDRKSTRLNSSHSQISYAVFCLKKKKKKNQKNT